MGQPPTSGPTGPTTTMRPQHRGGKPFSMPPPQGAKPTTAATAAPTFPTSGQPAKREIVFPADSIESTTPILYRRKRICRADLGTTDPWRIFMCLQSGLLSESTWALDVLNILLFDDTSVQYFGLAHLPKLLTLLLDHFQKSLADMFDPDGEDKYGYGWRSSLTPGSNNNSRTINSIKSTQTDNDASSPAKSVDLGQVIEPPNPIDRILVLSTTANYTMQSRKGIPVKIKDAEDDIFVLDDKRGWDIDADKRYQLNSCVGGDAWTYGHREPHPYDHIIDNFRAEIVNIPFARYIKSDKIGGFSNKLPTAAVAAAAATLMKQEPTIEIKSEHCNDASQQNGDKMATLTCSKRIKDDTNDTNSSSGEQCANSNSNSSNSCTSSNETDILMSTEATIAETSSTSTMKQEQQQQSASVTATPSSTGPMDSDCREVDMELERIPNGPHSNELAGTGGAGGDLKSASRILKEFDFRSTVHDPAGTLKRRRVSDYEDECYARDEASLYLINESQDTLARRCISISNILRNLTFVPGNELIFANNETFLAILGKLLLLHHDHPVRTQKTRNYDREDDTDFADSCSSLQGESEWWWEYLIQLRENMMVAVANIAGHMQLSKFDELITRPTLDGLLHWAVCPSAHGQDPFPSCSPNGSLSPQRLALEALCKLCVTDANVDLVIATPPFSRLEKLCSVLTRHLCRNEDQVLREFSVNLLHYLAAADSAMARTVAMQSPCISYLVAFIEQAEQTALGVANQHGINYLRENPDSMGTSLDMLRRTAGTLLHLARHPDNRPLFLQQEQRLLGLVMSHILDQQVALIISRVLFQVSRGSGPMTMAELKGYRPLSSAMSTSSASSSSSIGSSLSSALALSTTAAAATPSAVPPPPTAPSIATAVVSS